MAAQVLRHPSVDQALLTRAVVGAVEQPLWEAQGVQAAAVMAAPGLALRH